MSTANANAVARELVRGYAGHADLIADVLRDGDLDELSRARLNKGQPLAQYDREAGR